ncbi:hypothetical protein L6164_012034 [Bauhinia variegata]|uniref:Uncharacterized protein n=1 Tax=Bauhinia variegata TaxID=167791 RepID=A0ACB9P7U6_BAUVA|nr:hypothetical protein L6164_012034 [Bauhinia variegata]
MAHYQNQYGAVPASDNLVNKIIDTDTTTDTGGGAGMYKTGDDTAKYESTGYQNQPTAPTTASGEVHTAAAGGEHHHKKKGILEKIKEKLPGAHHH